MFRNFLTVSFFISMSRILGFVRDILIANYIGVSVLSDTFFAAFRLPNFFRRIFAEGAFNSAFVPIFVEKLTDKEDTIKAKNFAENIFSFLFFSLFIFTIILQLFMPFFMKILFPGFFSDTIKSDLLINLSRITVFYLFFIALVSLFSGILNSLGKFAIPASSPIILNLTLIASIFVFGNIVPNYSYALAWGVFFAGIFQLTVIVFFSYKKGYILYPKTPKINPDIKKFFRKLIPGLIGANVMQINLMVDSVFASMITGAISYLYYADRINQLPLAMIGIAINIALLPNLTRKIKQNELLQANNVQNLAIEVGLILVIPATLALTVIALPIIETLFERGQFNHQQSIAVANALFFYSLGLPSYVLVKIVEPAFFSRGDTKTPMKIAIICLINNIIFNYIFYVIGLDYVGIILASVLSSYLNLTILLFKLITKKLFYFNKDFKKKLFRIIIPAVFMAISLKMLKDYFVDQNYLNKTFELIIIIMSGLLVYFISSYYSKSLQIINKSQVFNKRK